MTISLKYVLYRYKQVGVGVTNLLQAVVDKWSFFSFQNTCKETRFYHRFEREN